MKINNIFFSISILISVLFISSCSTKKEIVSQLSKNNYKTNIEIKRLNNDYYLGKYIGNKKNCFPPIHNRLCENDYTIYAYEIIKKIDIESYELGLTLSSSNHSKTTEELIFLSAADISIQRGFPYFTILEDMIVSGCLLNGKSISTSGRIIDNNYSSSSKIKNDYDCGISTIKTILLFKDPEVLKGGVFYISKDNDTHKNLIPLTYLYNKTIEDLNYDFMKDDSKNTTEFTFKIIIPDKAWKIRYDANGLSKSLREKYVITNTQPYAILQESTNKEEKNLIEMNKVEIK